jgi:hypothetical protein
MKENTFEIVAKQYCKFILDFIKIIKEDYLYLKRAAITFYFKENESSFIYPNTIYRIDFKELLERNKINRIKILYNTIIKDLKLFISNNSESKDSNYIISTLPIRATIIFIHHNNPDELSYLYNKYSDRTIGNSDVWIKNHYYKSGMSLQESFNTFLYLIKLYQPNYHIKQFH